MDDYSLNPAGDELDLEAPETPEDVAVLYTWANVHGGKYRDFSASRREFRAQQRHRMVEQQRQAELEAARAREEAAAREMEQVHHLEEQAEHDEALRAEAEEARRRAEENIEMERQAAQQHVEAAESLRRALEEAQREMEEARRRAEEQAARYAEADARYRASAHSAAIPGEIHDPYYYAGPLEPTAFAPGRGVRSSVPQRVSSEKRIAETYYRSKGSPEALSRVDENSRPRPRADAVPGGAPAPRGASKEQPARRDRPQPFAEARTETAMDVRERSRPDQLERLHANVQDGYGDRDDDGYYDHELAPSPHSSNKDSRHSESVNVYLPPRLPSQLPEGSSHDGYRVRADSPSSGDMPLRGAGASGETVRSASQDPSPGSPHSVEQIRGRRRESSSADVQARTERRLREARSDSSDQFTPRPGQESADTPARVEEARPLRRSGDETERGRDQQESYSRPEWLVREASTSLRDSVDEMRQEQHVPAQQSTRMQSDERSERHRPRRSETHMIPAADGGYNLPPLPDRSAPPAARHLSSMQERESFREQRPVEERPRDMEQRSARQDPPPVVLAANPGSPQASRPSAERRRSDRSTGDRLDQELRAPSVDLPVSVPEYRSAIASRREEQAVEARPSLANARPADTLQQSRERVAARWFALKGLMGHAGETSGVDPFANRSTDREIPLPILAVVSLSGGVGKTSMVATVGRVLSSLGEVVLLADATPHGLLPYFFGARELRPDVVRTFSPPPGSRDATVFMVNYEADRLSNDEAGQTALMQQMSLHVKGAQRMLMDLNGTSAWLAKRLAGMNSTILVPVAADMNSVLGIKSVERFFAGLKDADGMPQQPFYVLNQFDASLPLHLDVREVLRQQLGERLLNVMIRRSPSVAEALAEGMTVMDYAPQSPVTEDYFQLAEWVRKRSAPALASLRSTRWSER